jgi:nucleoside-diphosphate-sugar epimerase
MRATARSVVLRYPAVIGPPREPSNPLVASQLHAEVIDMQPTRQPADKSSVSRQDPIDNHFSVASIPRSLGLETKLTMRSFLQGQSAIEFST